MFLLIYHLTMLIFTLFLLLILYNRWKIAEAGAELVLCISIIIQMAYSISIVVADSHLVLFFSIATA